MSNDVHIQDTVKIRALGESINIKCSSVHVQFLPLTSFLDSDSTGACSPYVISRAEAPRSAVEGELVVVAIVGST